MPPSVLRPRALLAVVGVGPLFVLAACGGGSNDVAGSGATPGDGTVTITITDDGCTAEPASIPAGSTTFDITNTGASA
ncbi:MAG: hypothetical protein ACRYF3_11550, partial [Janthinobacterium lividum]